MRVVCTCIISLCLISCTETLPLQNNGEGHYDISEIDRDIVYSLGDTWAYAQGEFISPALPIELYDRFERITQSWTQYTLPQPKYGYATYAIRVRGFDPEKVYALYFTRTSSAFTAFVNRRPFYSCGVPGRNFNEEQFDRSAHTVILPLKNETEANIVLHISNFNDRNPGVESPFYIGLYDTVQRRHTVEKLITSGIFALLLSMSAFFISLFLFYKKEHATCLFGILCFIFALRTICYNNFLIKDIFPALSGRIMFRLGYFTFPLAVIFMFSFIFNLFFDSSTRFLKFLLLLFAPLLIYSVLTLSAPFYFFTYPLPAVQAYTLLLALIAIGIVIRAIIMKKHLAILFCCAFICFIGTGIIDMLISNNIIRAPFISHFAILFLLMPMGFIVISHFSKAFKTLHKMTEHIEAANVSFQRFFPNEFMQFLHKKNIMSIKLGDTMYKDMFIAFVHIDTHTDLATAAARQELLMVYNDVIRSSYPLIKKYKGFIDKYLADGMMLLFYGSAEETVNCILEITALIKTINIHRTAKKLCPITNSAGIHYGSVMMGTIGEEERMDTTVISDAVNIASRLNSYAAQQDMSMLITESLRQQISDQYWRTHTCFYHGRIRFHGKKNPINIYEINVL
ncbi:MAG: adenylate/guanylate cyclase domain-containing protein [Treponema sp.]